MYHNTIYMAKYFHLRIYSISRSTRSKRYKTYISSRLLCNLSKIQVATNLYANYIHNKLKKHFSSLHMYCKTSLCTTPCFIIPRNATTPTTHIMHKFLIFISRQAITECIVVARKHTSGWYFTGLIRETSKKCATTEKAGTTSSSHGIHMSSIK